LFSKELKLLKLQKRLFISVCLIDAENLKQLPIMSKHSQ